MESVLSNRQKGIGQRNIVKHSVGFKGIVPDVCYAVH